MSHYDDDEYVDRLYVPRKKNPNVGMKKKLDVATHHLCTVLNSIGPEMVGQLPQDIQDWFEAYHEGDRKRAEKQKIESEIKDLRKKLKELKK